MSTTTTTTDEPIDHETAEVLQIWIDEDGGMGGDT